MSTTSPYQSEPLRRGPTLSRSFLPLALITLGVVFLLGNMVPERGRGGLVVLGLGAAFLIGRVTTGRYGYAVPAGILIAIGAYVGLQEVQALQTPRGPGLFFVLFGLGFALVYLIGSRPSAVWPLFPATIFLGLGLIIFGVTSLAPLAAFSWIVSYWPAALVLLGLWLLFRDYLPAPIRRPVATVGGLALLAYGVLAAAASVASGGPLVRTGFDASPFVDTVTLEQPIASGQTFSVNNSSGRTTIQAGIGSSVHVVATRHYNIGGQAPSVTLSPTGGGVTLDASGSNNRFFFGNSSSVDYVIDVPAETPVKVHSSSGSVELNNVGGEVRVDTSSGQIQGTGLRHLREAKSSSGQITLDGTFTDAAQIHTSSGTVNLKLSPESAVQLDVHTSSGSVVPNGLFLSGGKTSQRTLTGALGKPAPDAKLTIETSSGSVFLSQ